MSTDVGDNRGLHSVECQRSKPFSGDAGAVLRAAVLRRPVAEIFRVADMLASASSPLAMDFLWGAAEHIHERDDGSEAADFINGLLNRPGGPRGRSSFRADIARRRQVAAIADRIAAKRDPEQLASLIVELRELRRYYEFRDEIQDAVARHYRAADVMALIRACQHESLAAALNIVLTALQMPAAAKPEQVPAVIDALRQAGASGHALDELLAYVADRRLDREEIAAALRQAGLEDEARWIQSGREADRTASWPDHE